jgi:microcystin degradation protein MlrC
LRLSVARFELKSVTFLPETTRVKDFEHTATRGDAHIVTVRDTNSVLGGFVCVADAEGTGLHGIVCVNAGALALTSEEALDKDTAEIVAGWTHQAGSTDGLLSHLHGALATPARLRGLARGARSACLKGPGSR